MSTDENTDKKEKRQTWTVTLNFDRRQLKEYVLWMMIGFVIGILLVK